MGAPVITKAGSSYVSRMSTAVLEGCGLDDCTSLEIRPGTSMTSKMIINFGLQEAVWCERCCTLDVAAFLRTVSSPSLFRSLLSLCMLCFLFVSCFALALPLQLFHVLPVCFTLR